MLWRKSMNDIKVEIGYKYIDEVKRLIKLYMSELNRNLDFQDFDEELKHLEQKYAQPQGIILVAQNKNNDIVGCVAFHTFDEKKCEMKRLFVLPEYRSKKIGQLLVKNIIQYAKVAGYDEMLLDTIQPLKSAIRLYKKMGFQEIEPYYDNPMNDVIYMKIKL